ncbi:MAG: CoA ester lyase [Proteobacteria bacterium]|nr:CoA ester lyase [Pseudomonadota bacterium]
MKLRSLLFVPADSARKLSKSETVPADAIILDLEDSVAPENKAVARKLAGDFLSEHAKGRRKQLWVRINPVIQPAALEDLAGIMHGRPDGIVQPKTRSPDDVLLLGQHLEIFEKDLGFATGSTRILPLSTETPGAIFSLGQYVRCDQRLAGLTWGAEDLGAALGAQTNKDRQGKWTSPFQLARNLCLFAAHAAGVAAIDTIYADFRDPEGLRASCDEARRDGFSGKLAIHPDQVAIINSAFTPSEEDIIQARRIVELFEANPGAAVLSLDGVMLDIPHLKQARNILAMAE